ELQALRVPVNHRVEWNTHAVHELAHDAGGSHRLAAVVGVLEVLAADVPVLVRPGVRVLVVRAELIDDLTQDAQGLVQVDGPSHARKGGLSHHTSDAFFMIRAEATLEPSSGA